jgi:N-alpha-acetyl-L-2,4-diaminobutyrate deacetylase
MTTRIIAQPRDLDLESPGRRDYSVALADDSLWGDHLIPLTVMVGPEAETGRGVFASGSNHGNEFEGPVALKGLMREINIDDVRGRLILVPVLNPGAFESATRESVLYDGVNLNRAFVDGAGHGTLLSGITHRIAAFVREFIWPHVHVVHDLHAGGPGYEFALCSSFHHVADKEQAQDIEDAARWYGTPFIMAYQDQTPGLLPSDAERAGKITIGSELGWGQAVNPDGVRYGRHGVLASAIHHAQLAGTIEPIAHHADGSQIRVQLVDRDCYVNAPFGGFYEPLYRCGRKVSAGEVVGRMHDFNRIDEPATDIKAAVAGYILCQTWQNPVRHGIFVLAVAKEV